MNWEGKFSLCACQYLGLSLTWRCSWEGKFLWSGHISMWKECNCSTHSTVIAKQLLNSRDFYALLRQVGSHQQPTPLLPYQHYEPFNRQTYTLQNYFTLVFSCLTINRRIQALLLATIPLSSFEVFFGQMHLPAPMSRNSLFSITFRPLANMCQIILLHLHNRALLLNMETFSTRGITTPEKLNLKLGICVLILVTTRAVTFSYQLHLALISHWRMWNS